MKIRQTITRFRVVVADPPWQFSDGIASRGASAKYKCEKVDAIMKYRLPPLHEDCVLFLWRVAAMQQEALDVARAWGFDPRKGEIVWRKLSSTGKKEHFGMGRIVRGTHESCIVGTRGRPVRLHKSQRSLFSAPVPSENGRLVHSAKPHEFFEIVRRLFDGPRVSIFERFPREGFVCIGDEMPSERWAQKKSVSG